jgi:hypothetical protein
MEKWIKKNLRWIAMVLLFLFLIKSVQSCVQKSSIIRIKKNLTAQCDTIKQKNVVIIDSLKKEILTKDFIIQDLTFELKIAGVKVDEAQKRADAVQRTAEKVKSNTTIEIKNNKEQ